MPTVDEIAAEVSVEGVAESVAGLSTFDQAVGRAGRSQATAAAQSARHDAAMRKVGTGALIVGGALVAGFGLAAGASMRFEKAMSGVAAVSDATSREMDRLRGAAIDAGAATVFSASEAAQAEAELAKAGLSTADILGGGLRGSLDLAAAGQLELGEAATITAQALNIFQLGGAQASHVADLLAAGANKSAADVGQLGAALRQGGLLAKQTGLSIEETVGVLAMFGDNALIGSDAGTSLKTMLQRLTPISTEAASEMERLGISAYDSQGQFVGLDKFAQNLRTSLQDLTPEQRNAAMATIFGSDAVRAANILYEAGGKGVRDYTKAVDDQGAAGRMAGKQLDNLAGDIEQLKGSIETGLIQGGSGATTVLRTMAQAATVTVNAFGDLPPEVQTGIAALMGLVGVSSLVVGASLKIRAGLGRARDELLERLGPAGQFAGRHLGTAAKIAGGVTGYFVLGAALGQVTGNFEASGAAAGALMGLPFGPWGALAGGVFGAIGGALGLLGDDAEAAKQHVQALAKELDQLGEKDAARRVLEDISTELMGIGMGNDAMRAARQLELLEERLVGIGNTSPEAARRALAGLRELGEIGPRQFARLEAAVDRTTRRYQEHAKNAEHARDKNAELTGRFDELQGRVSDTASALDDFKTALEGALGVHVSAEQAATSYAGAMHDVMVSLIENGATLDINTEAGRANRSQLEGATAQAQRYAEAVMTETGSVDGANFVLSAHTQRLYDAMRGAGASEEATRSYIGELYGIPPDKMTNIHNTADLAKFLTDQLITKYGQIPPAENTKITAEDNASWVVDPLKAKLEWIEGDHIARVRVEQVGDILGLAAGGYAPGGGVLVGEDGPEFVELPRGAFVHDAAETRGFLMPPASHTPTSIAGVGPASIQVIVVDSWDEAMAYLPPEAAGRARHLTGRQ